MTGRAAKGDTLKPTVSIITLAVEDLERSLAFYRDGLGLPTTGIADLADGGTAFGSVRVEVTVAQRPAGGDVCRAADCAPQARRS